MEHKYSTIALLVLGSVIFVSSIIIALDSEDLDLICDTDNNILKRINGSWVCSIDETGNQTNTSDGGNSTEEIRNAINNSRIENLTLDNLNVYSDRGKSALRLFPLNTTTGYTQIQFYQEGKFDRITNSNPAYPYPEGDVLINVHKIQEDSGTSHRHLTLYTTDASNISINRINIPYMEDIAEIQVLNSIVNIESLGYLMTDKITPHDVRTNETNTINIMGEQNANSFLNFRCSGSAPCGKSGIIFSTYDAKYFFMFADSDTLRWKYHATLNNESKAFNYMSLNTTRNLFNTQTSFSVDTNDIYVNDSSGSVGIGRNPSSFYNLDIGAAGSGDIRVASIDGFSDLNLSTASGTAWIKLDSSGGDIQFKGILNETGQKIYAANFYDDGVAVLPLDGYCASDNSLLVRKNGQWICSTNAHLEEDLRFPVNLIRIAGASVPSWATLTGGLQTLQFSASAMNEGFLSTQLPHGRKENTTLGFHVHWTPTNTNTGNVVWCFEYSCYNINAVVPASTTACNVIPASGTSLKHQYSTITNVTNTLKYSAVCDMRLFRNGSDTRDTYNAVANLVSVDLHYVALNIGEDI